MSKITRWKGGLKSANRREVDMTKGSFNTSYGIHTLDTLDDEGNWQIAIDNNHHALETRRLEEGIFVAKASTDNSIHTDNFIVDNKAGGLKYEDNQGVSHVLIRTSVREGDATVLSNPSAGLDILKSATHPIRVIEGIGEPYYNEPGVGVGTDEWVSDDWELPFFNASKTNFYHGIVMSMMAEKEIPFRLSYTSQDGHIWYENMTQYEWELKRNYKHTTSLWPERTRVDYPDVFLLEEGDPFKIRVQYTEPVRMQGLWLRDNQGNKLPGPHDGGLFLMQGNGILQDVIITEVDFKAQGHGIFVTDVRCAEGEPVMLLRRSEPNEEEVIGIKTNCEHTVFVDVEWDRSTEYEGVVAVNGVQAIPHYKQDGTYKATVEVQLNGENALHISRGHV